MLNKKITFLLLQKISLVKVELEDFIKGILFKII